ncbi:uncharacterized protein [Spinacia oleracea]|uniref:Uncharacterized protein n=1 Tax=Spinacia oleracea TaxID=3562 RepID=A0ABM3RWC8_SPIOL|nr:uncharacterized protein LOC130472577 [Spinacia oleracea]XP_056699930.1 uncharacterized protein LOC130472577 [Spinacia oleracea]
MSIIDGTREKVKFLVKAGGVDEEGIEVEVYADSPFSVVYEIYATKLSVDIGDIGLICRKKLIPPDSTPENINLRTGQIVLAYFKMGNQSFRNISPSTREYRMITVHSTHSIPSIDRFRVRANDLSITIYNLWAESQVSTHSSE